MALEIIMPKLAMAMSQGTILSWFLSQGDYVTKGQILLEIETEKVNYEVEADGSGYLHIVVPNGETVPVEHVIAMLAENEEDLASLASQITAPAGSSSATVLETEEVVEEKDSALQPLTPPKGGRVIASPLARRLAQQYGVDISSLAGTGSRGQIVKRDVEKARTAKPANVLAVAAFDGEVVNGIRVAQTIPLAGIRKAIADHMQQSLAVSAQVSNMGEVDMTELIRLRKALLKQEESLGVRVTYTDIMVYLMSRALRYEPSLNASVIGEEIKVWKDVNVSVAVAVQGSGGELNLMVPVIRNADQMSLVEISKCARDLILRGREGKLTTADMEGGTVTLTNVGGFLNGPLTGTPILNQPQSLIVGIGAILDQPRVINGEIMVRPIMDFSMTYDHRAVEGVPVARFYSKVRELAENPGLLIA